MVMENRMRTIHPYGLNKGLSLKFQLSYQVWKQTPEDDQRVQQPKLYEYNNQDENASPNNKT